MAQSITNIDDERLIEWINQGTRRIFFLAPGVSGRVANAIADAWKRLGSDAVTVILDIDPEVCRLGYGTMEGLKTVKIASHQWGTGLCHQSGVRIGLLIVDEISIVFSPTPLLVEAGSTQPERPNAIYLGEVPKSVAVAAGLGANPHRDREIGLDLVSTTQMGKVEADLASNPPARFDLVRKVRVFHSLFQFVELEMTGCFLSKKKVRIPSELLGLAKDPETRQMLHANFDLVGKTDLKAQVNGVDVTEDTLRARKSEMVRKFLIPLKGYGSVVLKSNKVELEKAVERLRQDVTGFQKQITGTLSKRMEKNLKSLTKALAPTVARQLPEMFVKYLGPKPKRESVEKLLEQEIRSAFGRPESLLEEMRVTMVFKDITYESLKDEAFLQVASAAMPHIPALHEEYEVVKARELIERE
ncbi:MAG: hypothetical protein OEY86_12400 [Nitrospira sp.]|nr:hypothetical protein [Nitrospira sp.]